jgi:plasmid stability protein
MRRAMLSTLISVGDHGVSVAIMAQVLIRNLPETVVEAHRARARAHGRSLEQELREVIERAAPYSPEERLAVALRFQSQTRPATPLDPVEAVREGRDD